MTNYSVALSAKITNGPNAEAYVVTVNQIHLSTVRPKTVDSDEIGRRNLPDR